MVPEFTNEPLSDFGNPEQKQAMQRALRQVGDEFGRDWPLVIGGEQVTSGAWIESLNPCRKDQVVGRVARAGRAQAERALEAAWNAFVE
jgi:1-pyrroline-5-carboxylate dehydrogenase